MRPKAAGTTVEAELELPVLAVSVVRRGLAGRRVTFALATAFAFAAALALAFAAALALEAAFAFAF